MIKQISLLKNKNVRAPCAPRKVRWFMYPKDYDPNKFVCPPGERFEPDYIGEEDDNGMIHLVEVGKKDLVAMHQRDRDLNNVNLLYERFCNGDITALSRVQGSYLDAIGMPRDLRGVYETAENFRKAYNNLPAEKREKYTFERFMSEAGSTQWINDFVNQNSQGAADLATHTVSQNTENNT